MHLQAQHLLGTGEKIAIYLVKVTREIKIVMETRTNYARWSDILALPNWSKDRSNPKSFRPSRNKTSSFSEK